MQRFFVGLALTLLLVTAVGLAEPPTPSSPGPDHKAQEIGALIRQLGDPSFAVRQAATERLLELPDAVPALRKALLSGDPEVIRRAEAILAGLVRRGEKKALARLADFANNGDIDQAIELLVRRPHWDREEDAWQVMTGLADHLIVLGEKEFGSPAGPVRQDYLAAGDFRRYVEKNSPKLQTTGRVETIARRGERVVVRAEEIEAGPCSGDLLVSAGTIQEGTDKRTRQCDLSRSVVFAGGSVNVHHASRSIIVCAGDFTASDAENCLIVAGGNVRCKSDMNGCRIFAQGDVEFLRGAFNCGIVASGKVSLSANPKNNQDTIVSEGRPNALSFVKWFDPASVGAIVEKAEGGVTIKQADEGKLFAKAGLRAGDLVVSADGTALASPDIFRGLLRHKVVMREELMLEVRRDGKLVKVVVPFYD